MCVLRHPAVGVLQARHVGAGAGAGHCGVCWCCCVGVSIWWPAAAKPCVSLVIVSRRALMQSLRRLRNVVPLFAHVGVRVCPQAVEKDIDFLRVDCQPVAAAIRMQADVWKADYGRILRTVALQKMESVENTIATLNVGLSTAPTDLMSLKHVLAVIAEVREMKVTCPCASIAGHCHAIGGVDWFAGWLVLSGC